MNIQQAIQSSANVIRVTSVAKADVYKRFDKSYEDRVYFGIVQGVHNGGETAIIEAVEYSQQYGNLEINIRILNGVKDYAVFPASPDDLNRGFDDVIVRKRREIEKKASEIKKLE